MGQAIGFIFTANPPLDTQFVREFFQIAHRVRGETVFPNPDIRHIGCMLRLPQIRRAGQKRHPAIGLHNKALEKAKTERVIACEPVHALLCKQKHCIEPLARHRLQQLALPFGKFDRVKV